MNKRRYWQTPKDQRNQRRVRFVQWIVVGTVVVIVVTGGLMVTSAIWMEMSKTGGGGWNNRSNLRGIYQGFQGYYAEHEAYPSDLGALIIDEHLPARVFINPASARITPEVMDEIHAYPKETTVGQALKHEADWVNQHHDYVVLWPEMKWAIAGENNNYLEAEHLIVAHTREDVPEDLMTVLFGSSSVRVMSKAEFQERMSISQSNWAIIRGVEEGEDDE